MRLDRLRQREVGGNRERESEWISAWLDRGRTMWKYEYDNENVDTKSSKDKDEDRSIGRPMSQGE